MALTPFLHGRLPVHVLRTLGAGWVVAGIVAAFWLGASCVAADGGLSRINAYCAELAVFGVVCWFLLGLVLGFPLYYWLIGRNRGPQVE